MPAKLVKVPTAKARTKGGEQYARNNRPLKATRLPHIIKRKLAAEGKTIAWLAGEMRVTPQTIHNHMSGRNFMTPMNFQKMLKVLGMDLNEYYGVGKYARQGLGRHQLQIVTNLHHKVRDK